MIKQYDVFFEQTVAAVVACGKGNGYIIRLSAPDRNSARNKAIKQFPKSFPDTDICNYEVKSCKRARG